MSNDLTPAQAARLDEVERVARAMWDVTLQPYPWDKVNGPTQSLYRRLAVAAIDEMRGATDDGATVKRVREWLDEADDIELTTVTVESVRRVLDGRPAVGAPATADG